MSKRLIRARYPHPRAPHLYHILRLDDDFTSVVHANAPFPESVVVKGKDVMIAGVRSFGNIIAPGYHQFPDKPRVSDVFSFSDIFGGLQESFYMWGRRATLNECYKLAMIDDPPSADTKMSYQDLLKKYNGDFLAWKLDAGMADVTELDIKRRERLCCVVYNPHEKKVQCYDHLGTLIDGCTFTTTKLCDLGTYYAFCGVLSEDKTKFTVHCVWNSIRHRSLGPPYDRYAAEYAGLVFAPSLNPKDWPTKKRTMWRIAEFVPIICEYEY